MREKIASEGMGGGRFEFELFGVYRSVVVDGSGDVQLVNSVSRRHSRALKLSCVGGTHLMISQHHHATIDLGALRRLRCSSCGQICLGAAMFLPRILRLSLSHCLSRSDDGRTRSYRRQNTKHHLCFPFSGVYSGRSSRQSTPHIIRK